MMNKFAYPFALALAAAIAFAGCAHNHPVTPLPGPAVTEEPNPTIQPGPPVTDTNSFTETQFPTGQWILDPHALAGNTIHFAYDSAVIGDSESANLKAVAAALNSDASANVMIQGNCDERGTEEYNRSLGERRAEAAREALVGLGINVSRVHTISYGKDKPTNDGHDDAAWSQNRRDDFVLLHPKSGA